MQSLSTKQTLQKEALSSKTSSATAAPELYSFLNYRDFLRAFYDYRKQINTNFSFATFAKKGGLLSRSYLSLIMNGRRNLSLKQLPAMMKALELNARQAQYFTALVAFNQATTEAEREPAYLAVKQILKRQKNSGLTEIKVDESFYENPVAPFVYYMLQGNPLLDEKQLKSLFIEPVSIQEIRSALKSLKQLKLIKAKTDGNGWIVSANSTASTDETDAYFLRRFHSHVIGLAAKALEMPVNKRELSSLTLNLSQKEFDVLKKKLKELRAEIFSEFDSTDGAKPLFQVNLQLYPLTKTVNNSSVAHSATEALEANS